MSENEQKTSELDKQVESIFRSFYTQAHACWANYNGFKTFIPQKSDVFIVSWMKSGTTLMQQMTYQLLAATGRVPEDPEGERFSDISEVVPFVEVRDAVGIKESIHPYEPRVWKSHSTYEAFKGEEFRKCKFIYCVRDGLRVAPSLFDFTLDWVLDTPVEGKELREATYHKLFSHMFLGLPESGDANEMEREGGPWFSHIRDFMKAPLENVFFLIYEDAIKDLEYTVRRTADFMSIPVTDEIVARVARKCERDAMANDKRFNDTHISKMMGWDVEGGVRVRPKDAQGFKSVKIPERSLKLYNEMFHESFGVKTYPELLEILRKRNTE